jgi:long-subunit fatty acid transport protein
MINKSLVLTTLLLSALSVSTVSMAKSPSWNNVGLGYVSVDIDDSDFEPTGFILSGSKLINDNVYVNGSYRVVSEDIFDEELEVSTFNIGLGMRHGLNETTDLFGQVSYLKADVEFDNFSDDESGYSLAAGVKSMLSDNFEVVVQATRDSLDGESETAFGIGGAYYLNDTFSIGANYQVADDADILTVGVRAHF